MLGELFVSATSTGKPAPTGGPVALHWLQPIVQPVENHMLPPGVVMPCRALREIGSSISPCPWDTRAPSSAAAATSGAMAAARSMVVVCVFRLWKAAGKHVDANLARGQVADLPR